MRYILLLIIAINLFAKDIELKSKALGNFIKIEQVFNRYGCGGKNISPDLSWSSNLQNVKSYAITIFDPDAPVSGGWWHWIVFNIPANVKGLPLNASALGLLPKGSIEALNSYKLLGYGGPCPPKGDKAHRYITTIYALDKRLNLNAKSPISKIIKQINKHTIAKDYIVSLYSR